MAKESKLSSPLGIIFLTVFIDLIGFGMIIPILPLYARDLGASGQTIGWLVGIYSLMQFIFSPLFGKLSDRVGRRPILLFSIIGTSVGFLIMGLAHTLWLLFAARIIDGASGGNISTAQAYIADVTAPENRSKSMGLIGAAFGLGFTFGPAIGGVLSRFSPAAPFFFASGLAAVNAFLVYIRLPESLAPEHRTQSHERASVLDIFRNGKGWVLGTVIATYFVSITGFAIMTTLFALFTQDRFGFKAEQNGYLFAFVGILGVIIQGGLLRKLVPKVGEKRLAMLGAASLCVSMFFLPMTRSVAAVVVVLGGVALGNGCLTPTLNGLASLNANRRWQGRTLGFMQSAGSLGRLVGPVLAGYLMIMDPPHSLQFCRTPFWTSSAILLVAFVLTLTFASHRMSDVSAVTADPPL